MIRTSIYFALWTMICMIVAITGFFFVGALADMFSVDGWKSVGFLSMFAPVAGLVAGLLWALFHREGYRPGWLLYALLALLVVGVGHMLVFGVIFNVPNFDPVSDLIGAAYMFIVHGWLSVPVAFIGTALFVVWNRRRLVVA